MPLPIIIAGIGVTKIAGALVAGGAVAGGTGIYLKKSNQSKLSKAEQQGIIKASNEYENKFSDLKQDFRQQMASRDKNISNLNDENRCLNELLLKFKLDFVKRELANLKPEQYADKDMLLAKQKEYERELGYLTTNDSMYNDDVYQTFKKQTEKVLIESNLTDYENVIHQLDSMNIENNFFMYLDAIHVAVGGMYMVIGEIEFGKLNSKDRISIVKKDSVFHREFTVAGIMRTPKGIVTGNRNIPEQMFHKFFDIMDSNRPMESFLVDSASDGDEVVLYLTGNKFNDFEPGDYFVVENVTG